MSFRLFDLDNILKHIEMIAEVTYNGEQICPIFQDSGIEPKEYEDDDYWVEYLQYIYHLCLQRYFGFPDLPVASDSKTLLNVQLARIRFNLLPTLTAKDEYARIFAMTQAACVPILKFKKITGLTQFDHFICNYEKHSVLFFVNNESFEDTLDAAETHTFKFIEETLGCTMPLDEVNIKYIETLENPFADRMTKQKIGAYFVDDAVTDTKKRSVQNVKKSSKNNKKRK